METSLKAQAYTAYPSL